MTLNFLAPKWVLFYFRSRIVLISTLGVANNPYAKKIIADKKRKTREKIALKQNRRKIVQDVETPEYIKQVLSVVNGFILSNFE